MPFLVSRRSLLRGAAAVSGAGLFRMAASGQKPNGRRVLALVGDRYHNPDYIRVALSKMFEGQGVTVDYTIDYSQLSRSLLSNYQLFLCLRDGMIWPNGYLGPDAYTSYEVKTIAICGCRCRGHAFVAAGCERPDTVLAAARACAGG